MRTVLAGLLGAALALCATLPALAAEPKAGPKTGEVPPALLGKDRNGDLVDLAQHRGKVVVVTFWASWCGPCRAAIPKIKKFYAAHRDRLTIVSASVDEKKDNWTKAVKQEAMPWAQLWLTGKDMEKAGSAYVINSIPRLVLIAPDGKVVKVTFDPEEIFKAILSK